MLSNCNKFGFQHFWSLTHARDLEDILTFPVSVHSFFFIVKQVFETLLKHQKTLPQKSLLNCMRGRSKPKTNQEFVWNSWFLQYIHVQQKTYFLWQNKTSWILLPVSCGTMIWSMWRSVCQERDSQRHPQEPAAGIQAWLMSLLTENRKGHVGVRRGARRSKKPFSSSLLHHDRVT